MPYECCRAMALLQSNITEQWCIFCRRFAEGHAASRARRPTGRALQFDQLRGHGATELDHVRDEWTIAYVSFITHGATVLDQPDGRFEGRAMVRTERDFRKAPFIDLDINHTS